MKIPKVKNRFCPKCKAKTSHKVDQYKSAGRRGPLSHGSKERTQARGKHAGMGSHGRFSKGPISSFKRTGAKISKKTTLRFLCTVCKKMSQQSAGFRAKKVELV